MSLVRTRCTILYIIYLSNTAESALDVGNFLIGGFFSVYADLLVTVMAQAAVELINTGHDWEPEFHSRAFFIL